MKNFLAAPQQMRYLHLMNAYTQHLFTFTLGALFTVGLMLIFNTDSSQQRAIPSPTIPPVTNTRATDHHLGSVGLVNPLLDCAEASGMQFREVRNFKVEIQQQIDTLVANKSVTAVGLYFRDLNNGRWLGIDEKVPFIPASLIKVGIMISYLKHLESEPDFFSKVVTFKVEDSNISNVQQNIPPSETLTPGKEYSVQELVERMMIYSDNTAMALLLKSFPDVSAARFFEDINTSFEKNPVSGDTEIGVRQYASFFRLLYNASYLNTELSHWALSVMTKTTFRNGIAAGIPEGITIAHKFGERKNEAGLQLHECGIIYHPQSPYLLCIMTRGSDIEQLSKVLQQLSAFIYQQVENNTLSKPTSQTLPASLSANTTPHHPSQ